MPAGWTGHPAPGRNDPADRIDPPADILDLTHAAGMVSPHRKSQGISFA
jgi:hypothetical protein